MFGLSANFSFVICIHLSLALLQNSCFCCHLNGSLHHVASCAPMINRALFVSHDLCRDQPDHELSRYANYLTANVNLLEKAAMQLFLHFCNENRAYCLFFTCTMED